MGHLVDDAYREAVEIADDMRETLGVTFDDESIKKLAFRIRLERNGYDSKEIEAMVLEQFPDKKILEMQV